VVRTPTVRCAAAAADRPVHLKLENLQPAGSFKLRPIANAMLSRPRAALSAGVHTFSSGNSSVAMAWMARRMGLTATAVVPDGTPQSKLELLRNLDARIVSQPFAQWWSAVTAGGGSQFESVYIDAVRDPASFAGNGTIAREILEDVPDVEAIFREMAVAAPAPAPVEVAAIAVEEPPPAPRPSPAAMTLTPEDVDAIARAVVARLTDQVVREIAWDVVPDVAEAVVRERLRELERETD